MFGSSGEFHCRDFANVLCLNRRRFYNVVFGLFQAPYYAFSQTMMAELTPPGFDNMVRTCPLFRPTSLSGIL